jgi:hypothetical protein
MDCRIHLLHHWFNSKKVDQITIMCQSRLASEGVTIASLDSGYIYLYVDVDVARHTSLVRGGGRSRSDQSKVALGNDARGTVRVGVGWVASVVNASRRSGGSNQCQ